MEELPVTVIVIAKEPVPGRVKTRLTPPFTPEQAAALAEAALTDTLDAVAAAPVARRVLALAGMPGPWLPPGFEVIGQRGGGLDERLAAAFDDAAFDDGHTGGGQLPMVLIGMDTPQVTPELLAEAARPLVSRVADAVFGPAADGGYWLLGLRAPDPSLLLGVPMSRPDTGRAQLGRLAAGGLRVAMLPELTDVDHAPDAERIASQIPGSRFAAAYDRLAQALTVSALPGGRARAGQRRYASGPSTVTRLP
jgi:rSAM/selenodomain-associated transferase 1